MHKPLNIATATALATVIGWAQRNARITWLVDGSTDRTVTGTARCIGDELGSSVPEADIRDLYLRVSSTFEHFLPVGDVVSMIRNGCVYEER